jgi:hypothetical protein
MTPDLDLDLAAGHCRGVLGGSQHIHRREELLAQQVQTGPWAGREHLAALTVVGADGRKGRDDPGQVGLGDDQAGFPVAGHGPGRGQGGGGHAGGLQVLS